VSQIRFLLVKNIPPSVINACEGSFVALIIFFSIVTAVVDFMNNATMQFDEITLEHQRTFKQLYFVF